MQLLSARSVTFSTVPDKGIGQYNRPRSLLQLHQFLRPVLADLNLFCISNTATNLLLNDRRINQSNAIELYRQYAAHMFFKTT